MDDSSDESIPDIRRRNHGLKLAIITILVVTLIIGLTTLIILFLFTNAFNNHNDQSRLSLIPATKLIRFNTEDGFSSGRKWVADIDRFLQTYEYPPPGLKTSCKEGEVKPASAAHIPCTIDITTQMTPYYTINFNCSRENHQFGYGNSHIRGAQVQQPCVALKFNTNELSSNYWIPEPYTASDLTEAEANKMPRDLQEHITRLTARNSNSLNTTWITCDGETPADKVNLGKIAFFYPGFRNSWDDPTITQFGRIPNFNFPDLKQDGYLSPFLWIKFLEPKGNVLISIECKAWARNIKLKQGYASIKFQLFIENYQML